MVNLAEHPKTGPGLFSGLLQRLKERYRRQMFLPSPLAIVVNPFFIARRGLYQRLRRLAPSIEGNILDFGCGSKPYESLFENARSYVGCDLAVTGHEHRTSKIDTFYDGHRLPFSDEKFDAVVSFETLEHVFNLSEMLAEVARVTKRGGRLLVTIPFAWNEHEMPYDFARYTSSGITHLLTVAGYEIERLEKTSTYVPALAQMFTSYFLQRTPSLLPLRFLVQLLLLFPLNLIGVILGAILPADNRYFLNLVVMARKPEWV